MIGASHGISMSSRIISGLAFKPTGAPSHIMEIDDVTGETIEAIQFKGVVHGKNYHEFHRPGTRIDLYDYKHRTPEKEAAIWNDLLGEVGKGYDWAGIWGFLRRKIRENPLKWFCSELSFWAHLKNGIVLLNNILPCQVSPATYVTSTELIYVGFLIVGWNMELLGKVTVSEIAKRNRLIEERCAYTRPLAKPRIYIAP